MNYECPITETRTHRLDVWTGDAHHPFDESSPEEAEAAIGTALAGLPDDALERIARELFGRLSQDASERLSTFFVADVDPRDSALLRELRQTIDDHLGWRNEDEEQEGDYVARVQQVGGERTATNETIRAAGYDPDEVGAAEVIEKLSGATLGDVSKPYESIGGTLAELESAMASAHGRDYTMPADTAIESIMMLIKQRDSWEQLADELADRITDLEEDLAKAETSLTTDRAQIREWRETVGPILDAAESDSDGVVDSQRIREEVCIRSHALRRLLSATPGGATDEHRCRYRQLADRWSKQLDDASAELTAAGAPLGTMLERAQWLRKRVEELETELKEAWSHVPQYCVKTPGESLAAVVARIENSNKCLREAAFMPGSEEWQSRIREVEDFRERATRAETAVEAMRKVVQYFRQNVPHRPDTTVFDDRFQDAFQALAAYDANKPEPTGEQPQARADKFEGATCAGKDGDANARPEQSGLDRVEESPPPARVVGGDKLEPLELRCADAMTDKLEMRRDCGTVAVTARERDRVATVYLDRASVRRAVDWQLAWLCDGCDSVTRVALQRAAILLRSTQ